VLRFDTATRSRMVSRVTRGQRFRFSARSRVRL